MSGVGTTKLAKRLAKKSFDDTKKRYLDASRNMGDDGKKEYKKKKKKAKEKYDAEKKNIELSEGIAHARLANKLSDNLKCDIYVVPRIYSDELIRTPYNYLLDFGLCIKDTLKIFYCGKNIVEKNKSSFAFPTQSIFIEKSSIDI